MIGVVMFLGGFFASLLAFYGRNAPLLMLAAIMLAFCWVGNERVHKAFRAIPNMLVSLLGIFTINLSHAFIFDKYYCTEAEFISNPKNIIKYSIEIQEL